MKFRNIIWCLLAVLALASCKEEDDTVEEFVDWQNTNDAFFSRLVSEKSGSASTQNTWVVIPCYTMPTVGYTLNYYDNIVAEKLEQEWHNVTPADRLCEGSLCGSFAAFNQLSARSGF